MSVPNMTGIYIHVEPFVEMKQIQLSSTDSKKPKLQPFFVKKSFEDLVEKTIQSGGTDFSEEWDDINEKIEADQKAGKPPQRDDLAFRERIIEKIKDITEDNIQWTLDHLFAKGNPFYLNKHKYTIHNYVWNHPYKEPVQKENVNQLAQNPIFQSYATQIEKIEKNQLIVDYITYVNYFWRNFFNSLDREYPVYRNIDEFYRKENEKTPGKYSTGDLAESKRILYQAPQNVKVALFKRSVELQKIYADRSHTPRNIQDLFKKIIELDARNQIRLVNTPRNSLRGGSGSLGDPSGVCYYIVVIDLELVPKDEITPVDDIRLNCQMKRLEISKAYNELLGKPPQEPPLFSLYGVPDYKKTRKEREQGKLAQFRRQSLNRNRAALPTGTPTAKRNKKPSKLNPALPTPTATAVARPPTATVRPPTVRPPTATVRPPTVRPPTATARPPTIRPPTVIERTPRPPIERPPTATVIPTPRLAARPTSILTTRRAPTLKRKVPVPLSQVRTRRKRPQ